MTSLAERRARCDAIAERFYPLAGRREHRMRNAIEERLPSGGRFLDAGSGPYLGMARHFVRTAEVSVGMDLEPFHRRMLETGALAVRGNLAALPFASASFDVISLRSVLEHIENPTDVFRGMARVLRRGGWIVALAPSRWYFASIIGRLVPETAGRRILEFAVGPTVHDNYPVYYRANTPRAVARAARAAGLEMVEARVCPNPPGYLKFSPVLFRLGILYDRAVGAFRATRALQASFLYLLRKP